jgi:MFS family permease
MKTSLYRRYVLLALMTIYAYNFADRLALGLVLQQIKADLSLSDTQLGILSGIAFASLYAVMGIPIARWADRGNRVTIISITTAVWSVMIALSGFARTFVQLILLRAGAAVGEAGCIPPAHSLISDYFTRTERPRALAIHMLGGSLSVVIGYFVAGWLNELYGWRVMFIVLGLPGLGLAALAYFTLKEPRRSEQSKNGIADQLPRDDTAAPNLTDVYKILWANQTFRQIVFCFLVVMFCNYAILQWQAVFFMRSYSLRSGELGTWFAAIYSTGGVAGTYLGGVWASSRFADNNEQLQLRVVATAYLACGICSLLMYLSTNRYWAFGFMGLTAVAGGITTGPLFAAIQTVVPRRMRATSIAVLYLFGNLLGMGLGPVVTGAISDALAPWAGQESLRYAMTLICPAFAWGAWHAWRASGTVVGDARLAQVGV